MRKKQCATRRIAGSDDEADEAATAAASSAADSPAVEQVESPAAAFASSEMLGIDEQNGRLDDGTVVVQPEAVGGNDDSSPICLTDDSPVAEKSAGRSSLAPGIYDTVKCTACGKKVNPYNGTMQLHPMLRVLVCQKCFKFYSTGQFDVDSDGKENQCRWCGEGGSLICCDKCQHSFCKSCIRRNLGRTALQAIEELPDEAEWSCYACDASALKELQEEADVVTNAVRDHYKEASKRSEKHKSSGMGRAKLLKMQQQRQLQLQHQQKHQLLMGGIRQPGTASMMGLKLDLSAVPKAGTALIAPKVGVGQPGRLTGHQRQQQQQQQLLAHQLGVGQSRLHQQQRQQQLSGRSAVTGSAMPDHWFKKNVRIETILADIESVNGRNIGTALNATVALLQGMMRQYSRFLQELNQAKTAQDRAGVVTRFKNAYRNHLFMRLGRLRTLIAEEERSAMPKAAPRPTLVDLTGRQRQHQPQPVIGGTKTVTDARGQQIPIAELLPELNRNIRAMVEKQNQAKREAAAKQQQPHQPQDDEVVVVLSDSEEQAGCDSEALAKRQSRKSQPRKITLPATNRRPRDGEGNGDVAEHESNDDDDNDSGAAPSNGEGESEAQPASTEAEETSPVFESFETNGDSELPDAEQQQQEEEVTPDGQQKQQEEEKEAEQNQSTDVDDELGGSPLRLSLWGKRPHEDDDEDGRMDDEDDEEPAEKRSRSPGSLETPPSSVAA